MDNNYELNKEFTQLAKEQTALLAQMVKTQGAHTDMLGVTKRLLQLLMLELAKSEPNIINSLRDRVTKMRDAETDQYESALLTKCLDSLPATR